MSADPIKPRSFDDRSSAMQRERSQNSPWRHRAMVRSGKAMASGQRYKREAAIRAACKKIGRG